MYLRIPNQQMAVFNPWPLEATQNVSDTWLEHIEWTFVSASEEMNIVIETTRLCHEERKWI